jgi:hypothetical protein
LKVTEEIEQDPDPYTVVRISESRHGSVTKLNEPGTQVTNLFTAEKIIIIFCILLKPGLISF